MTLNDKIKYWKDRNNLEKVRDVKEFIRQENDFEIRNIEHMSEEFKTGVRYAVIEIKKNRKKLSGLGE